uniref:C2 domain-containing protein n=1 Tax=Peronospora matthiolae TaxID=2874970 RepID=A0AAV1URL5_9STRA
MSRFPSDQSLTTCLQQRPASASSIRARDGTFTLFLRVHSARGLPALSKNFYCKLYLGDTPITGGFGRETTLKGVDKALGGRHQTFHTKVQSSASRDSVGWNEKFQLSVGDPSTEYLTIRVKNHIMFYSPAVGASVVCLRQLSLGSTVDEWFPLKKNTRASGQIRLQLCLMGTARAPGRRYSQANVETIQRSMLRYHDIEEANRQESDT